MLGSEVPKPRTQSRGQRWFEGSKVGGGAVVCTGVCGHVSTCAWTYPGICSQARFRVPSLASLILQLSTWGEFPPLQIKKERQVVRALARLGGAVLLFSFRKRAFPSAESLVPSCTSITSLSVTASAHLKKLDRRQSECFEYFPF